QRPRVGALRITLECRLKVLDRKLRVLGGQQVGHLDMHRGCFCTPAELRQRSRPETEGAHVVWLLLEKRLDMIQRMVEQSVFDVHAGLEEDLVEGIAIDGRCRGLRCSHAYGHLGGGSTNACGGTRS